MSLIMVRSGYTFSLWSKCDVGWDRPDQVGRSLDNVSQLLAGRFMMIMMIKTVTMKIILAYTGLDMIIVTINLY